MPIESGLRTVTAAVFVVLGGLANVQAWLGWARSERALRDATALPGSLASTILATGLLVGAVLLAIGLFL